MKVAVFEDLVSMGECDVCWTPDKGAMCFKTLQGDLPYNCTRPEGHDGDHIACGTGLHQAAFWSDDECES